MLVTAIVLFAIAALGGLAMVGIRASRAQNPPTALAVLHGLLAAVAVVLVIVAAANGALPAPGGVALAIFVIVALVGASLFFGHQLKQSLLPLGVAGAHAVGAVIGLILLIVAAT
jgi:hypothetical protein